MNAFTLKHNTSREAIERATKDEIGNALNALAGYPRINTPYWKKTELVSEAAAAVANLAEEHAKAEAAKKAAHDAALEAEKANPVIAVIKADFLAALEKHDATLAKTAADFTEYATKNGLAYAIEWRAAEVFEADAKRRELAGLIGFAGDEATNPTKTFEEYLAALDRMTASLTDRVLDAYISHSTNPVANLKSEYALKAKGWMAKVLARTVPSMRKALADNDASHLWVYFG